jgi:hypothetical protein
VEDLHIADFLGLIWHWSLTCSLTSCLILNSICGGALRCMTYDMSLFRRFQEQEGGMCVELGDAATYLVRGVGSISL